MNVYRFLYILQEKMKLHVAFKNSKKILSVETEENKVMLNQIEGKIKHMFTMSDEEEIFVQYFDKDFEEWVDFDLSSMVTYMTKLRVLSSISGSEEVSLASETPSTDESSR